MIDALAPNDIVVVGRKLSPDVIDPALAVLAREIRYSPSVPGVLMVQRLRRLVAECAPARPLAAPQLGVLPEILGSIVTLKYPLEQLEHFLSGDRCDIDGEERASVYLAFVRFHLWKLERLMREQRVGSR
jgi:hypothetical protein